MDVGWFIRGIVLGFAIAAPVGPIGILVIRRTLIEGRLAGFITGLGAATADAIFGAIGALGLTVVAALLLSGHTSLRLIGGLFLCYLGIRTVHTVPIDRPPRADRATYLRAYVSTLFLTLTNPATILSFAAVYAGLGFGMAAEGYRAVAVVVGGVFVGSALWWLLLSGGVSFVRTKVTPGMLRWINYISGTIIIGFGVAAVGSVLW